MAENLERELEENQFDDKIDSVLSARRRQAAQNATAVPRPAPGARMRPDGAQGTPRRAAPASAQNAPQAGHRIGPNYERWASSQTAPKQAPMAAPRQAPQNIQRTAPAAPQIPKAAPQQFPKAAPQQAPQAVQKAEPVAPLKAAPAVTPKATPQAAPQAAPVQTPKAESAQVPKTSPAAPPKAEPKVEAKDAPAKAPKAVPVARTYTMPEPKREAPPVREDDDVNVAGKKLRDERANEATRVTDMSDKVEPSEPATTRKKKKKKDDDVGGTIVSSLVRTVIYLVTVTVIAVVLSIFIINVGNDVFAFVKSDEAIDVTIPENATRADIADILYDNGVINYKTAFKIYGSLKHIEENFVAGNYTVTPMMNYKDLYNAFKEKPVSGTTWITIPEGYTTDEIIALMLKNGIGGTKEDYVKAINEDDYSEFDFVKELDENGYDTNRFYKLEGYLFPDTYEFYNASDAHTVVRKMLKRFDEIYNEKLRARAEELGMTTDQVVILASMIEKEAGLSSDFRNVSAVFHNRLAAGGGFLYLSSDATAVYAIQHETGERPKHVTAEMMKKDTPYNTYLHAGYPPGAIANPGMNAIKYALYPADTYYYYFVSLESGETLFATNEYEHEQNVARMRAEQGE